MKRVTTLTDIIAMLFVTALIMWPFLEASANDKPAPRTLDLTASADMKVKPDLAYISSGVETNARTAKRAVAQNSKQMTKIIAALKEIGLKDEDIQTSNFSIQPQYESYENRKTNNRPPRIVGYKVNNDLFLTIKNVEKVGDILDTLVSLGSNRISNISFAVRERDKYLDQVREKAMLKAFDRARLYTRAAGVKLGNVLSIRESQNFRAAPMARKRNFVAQESSVPIAAGSQSLQIQVTVRWELVDKDKPIE